MQRIQKLIRWTFDSIGLQIFIDIIRGKVISCQGIYNHDTNDKVILDICKHDTCTVVHVLVEKVFTIN
jgi:hypothetical protein